MTIQTATINRNLMRKLLLMVLWRNACIPNIAPIHPPSPVNRKRLASDILRCWAFALYLSIHRTMKVRRLMRMKYRMRMVVRVMGYLRDKDISICSILLSIFNINWLQKNPAYLQGSLVYLLCLFVLAMMFFLFLRCLCDTYDDPYS